MLRLALLNFAFSPGSPTNVGQPTNVGKLFFQIENYRKNNGLTLVDTLSKDYDGIIIAVAHRQYYSYNSVFFESISTGSHILMDSKGIYSPAMMKNMTYWRL